MASATTSILLVDDHPVLRSGLKALLDQEPDLKVVGEAGNGREAIRLVKELLPDVVVMDLRMPELNGIDATRQAISIRPGLKVIALSAAGDDRLRGEMYRAGAAAFIAKESAFEELIAAIRGTLNCVSNSVDRKRDSFPTAFSDLSPREREVLQLLAEGYATKEVASKLGVSIKTAETHRRNLMDKLDLDSIAGLTKFAIREGITGA